MQSPQITVIIPVYNIAQRGYDRLMLSLYSLVGQNAHVIVCDASNEEQAPIIQDICNKFDFVRYVHFHLNSFNKPKLQNQGIILSETDWVLCGDVDFCYQTEFIDFIHGCTFDSNSFIVKLIYQTKDKKPTTHNVDTWQWQGKAEFDFGKEANGLQLFHKDWFTWSGGYDEKMEGWGAMDNDMVNRSKMAGLHITYVHATEGPEVVHQWHKQEKNWSGPDMRANWKIRDSRTTFKVNN